jgi:hypothetical protein
MKVPRSNPKADSAAEKRAETQLDWTDKAKVHAEFVRFMKGMESLFVTRLPVRDRYSSERSVTIRMQPVQMDLMGHLFGQMPQGFFSSFPEFCRQLLAVGVYAVQYLVAHNDMIPTDESEMHRITEILKNLEVIGKKLHFEGLITQVNEFREKDVTLTADDDMYLKKVFSEASKNLKSLKRNRTTQNDHSDDVDTWSMEE